MTCLNEILGKGTTWMRACGITSHFSHGEGTECFSSTARGAASLYVVGTYLRKEVKPPFGRFYEIKK